jgi:hypothetical protein
MIEAGNRMEQKYLTPGWFSLFKIAVDEAKARNMRVWVDNPTGAMKDNSAALCDYMNPETTKQIIAWTHEGYRKDAGCDFFKNMRVVGIPGIDAIWTQIWYDHEADYPKMASSAAHLFGKPHALTESFAAFTNPVDVPTAKWVIDYQLVRGINLVQVMFRAPPAAQ